MPLFSISGRFFFSNMSFYRLVRRKLPKYRFRWFVFNPLVLLNPLKHIRGEGKAASNLKTSCLARISKDVVGSKVT